MGGGLALTAHVGLTAVPVHKFQINMRTKKNGHDGV